MRDEDMGLNWVMGNGKDTQLNIASCQLPLNWQNHVNWLTMSTDAFWFSTGSFIEPTGGINVATGTFIATGNRQLATDT